MSPLSLTEKIDAMGPLRIEFAAGFIGLTLALLLNTAVAQNGQLDDGRRSLLHNKLLLLQSMTEQSAAAQRIEASQHSREAKALLAQAREAHRQAQALLEQEDYAGSEARINEGLRLFSEAARNVADLKRESTKEQQRYQELSERIDSFHQAFARIVKEKGPATLNLLDQTGVDAKRKQASKLYGEQRYREANLELEQVLAKLEHALTKARDQETLVRALEFASAEDEYAYEVERNHSHEMLVRLLLSQENLNPARRAMIDRFMELNSNARVEADTLARQGDHTAALQKLESGTQQLVRALRVAGMAF